MHPNIYKSLKKIDSKGFCTGDELLSMLGCTAETRFDCPFYELILPYLRIVYLPGDINETPVYALNPEKEVEFITERSRRRKAVASFFFALLSGIAGFVAFFSDFTGHPLLSFLQPLFQ